VDRFQRLRSLLYDDRLQFVLFVVSSCIVSAKTVNNFVVIFNLDSPFVHLNFIPDDLVNPFDLLNDR